MDELDSLFKSLGEVTFDLKQWGEVRWRKGVSSGAAPNMASAIEQVQEVDDEPRPIYTI